MTKRKKMFGNYSDQFRIIRIFHDVICPLEYFLFSGLDTSDGVTFHKRALDNSIIISSSNLFALKRKTTELCAKSQGSLFETSPSHTVIKLCTIMGVGLTQSLAENSSLQIHQNLYIRGMSISGWAAPRHPHLAGILPG